jgi:hypothetical protein
MAMISAERISVANAGTFGGETWIAFRQQQESEELL